MQEQYKFEALQDLWQNQTSDRENDQLVEKLVKQDRKQRNEKRYMLITFVGTSLIMFANIFLFLNAPLSILGLLLIVATMWWFYWITQKNKTFLNGKSPDLSNQGFIQDQIKNLEEILHATEKHIPIYAIGLVAGLNLVYVRIFDLMDLSWPFRLLFHGGGTLFIMLIFIYGVVIKLSQYKKKISPVLEELREMSEEANDIDFDIDIT